MPKATTSTTDTATSTWDSMQKFYDMVGDTADHLRNNFQYGETVRGHMSRTRSCASCSRS